MYQDLHSHTYYSFCGKDAPETIVEAAINGGLDLFGITDHNYGVGFVRHDLFCDPNAPAHMNTYGQAIYRYYDHINLVKQKYASQIEVLRGIEICTLTDESNGCLYLPDEVDISFFDYCLIENLDSESSKTGGDLFAYAKRLGTPVVGVAHTDMFGFIKSKGMDPLDYFKRMAEGNIFWEMNVTYDSIHGYRQHKYMLDFFSNEEQQETVRKSGVRVSVGFDGHRVEDYLPDRVKEYNDRLTEMGVKKPFEK